MADTNVDTTNQNSAVQDVNAGSQANAASSSSTPQSSQSITDGQSPVSRVSSDSAASGSPESGNLEVSIKENGPEDAGPSAKDNSDVQSGGNLESDSGKDKRKNKRRSRRKNRKNRKKDKETESQNAKIKEKFENIVKGEGINLIPPMTEEEIKVEETKSSFNIGAALAILLLVVISLVIVGYNVLTKSELQKEKRILYNDYESRVEGYKSTIVKNSFIKKRLDTYKNIQTEAIPYERVLAYWKEISQNLAEIEAIEIHSNLTFSVEGKADNLEQVAKLWHFLSIDDAIETVNLESLNTDPNETSFEFEGSLNYDFFISSF
ncbi:hypothetical protein GF357_02255 [Candidatus Dojkabacteria bacterium]|nr:hypothetical protein [Candidatus Dojkabacteria bacterium]